MKAQTIGQQYRARQKSVQRSAQAKLNELSAGEASITARLRTLDQHAAGIRVDAAVGDLDAVRGRSLAIQQSVGRLAAVLRTSGVGVSF